MHLYEWESFNNKFVWLCDWVIGNKKRSEEFKVAIYEYWDIQLKN